MAHLNYRRPYSNKLKTVIPTDFDNVRVRFNSADFSNIIPNLCLADLFLIEFCKSDSWQNGIIALNAYKCLYSCNFCNTCCASAGDLVIHLKTRRHHYAIQDGNYRYHHPVFTYTLKNKKILNENEIDPKVASKQVEDELYRTSRLTFLCAHLTAKMFEDEMISKGMPLPEYTIPYSGKRIVTNASKEEFDEAAKKLQNDALQNLEKKKVAYKNLLSEVEKKSRYVVQKNKKGKVTEKMKKITELSKSEQNKLNFIKKMINLLSGENVISNNPIRKSSLIEKSNVEDEPDIDKTKTQTTSNLDDNNLDLAINSSSSGVIASSSPDLILVLRLLAGLENDLGCLGPKIIDLLSHTLVIIRKSNNKQPLSEVLTFENCLLIKTAVEKLRGISEILQGSEEAKIEIISMVISKAIELLKYAPNWEVQNKVVSNAKSIIPTQNTSELNKLTNESDAADRNKKSQVYNSDTHKNPIPCLLDIDLSNNDIHRSGHTPLGMRFNFGQSEANLNSADRTHKHQYYSNEDFNLGISPTYKVESMYSDKRFIDTEKNDIRNFSRASGIHYNSNTNSSLYDRTNFSTNSYSFSDNTKSRNSGVYKSSTMSYFQQQKPYAVDDHRKYRNNLSRHYGMNDILWTQERNH